MRGSIKAKKPSANLSKGSGLRSSLARRTAPSQPIQKQTARRVQSAWGSTSPTLFAASRQRAVRTSQSAKRRLGDRGTGPGGR
jgi:hypothetical protein